MLHRAICEGKQASGLTSAARHSETLPESAPTVAATLQRGIGNQAVARLIGPRVDAKETDADRIASNVMQSRLPPALSRMAGDAQIRTRFESAYGQDFGRVRIHTGSDAARSAAALRAKAYTLGEDVVFGANQYRPEHPQGQRLLAHELAHVVQQRNSGTPMVQREPDDDVPEPDDPFEKKKKGPGDPDTGDKGITVDTQGKVCVDTGLGDPNSDPFCFSKKGFEDWWKKTHPKGPKLPPRPKDCPVGRWRPILGSCCPPGTLADGLDCIKPPKFTPDPLPFPIPKPGPAPDKTQQPTPGSQAGPGKAPATQHTTAIEILFKTDRPAPNEKDFTGSLLRGDRSAFDQLVKQLKDNPQLKVQLVGKASIEGPGNAEQRAKYNRDLGLRRARIVANELIKSGIPASRIADPPVQELRGECELQGDGVVTCGSAGASDPPAQADREVLARVFAPAP